MSDLIHANELLEELEEWYADLYDTNPKRQLGVNDAIVIACQMPTVDAIPIEWIKEWIEEIEDHPAYTERERYLVMDELKDMLGAWAERKEE